MKNISTNKNVGEVLDTSFDVKQLVLCDKDVKGSDVK